MDENEQRQISAQESSSSSDLIQQSPLHEILQNVPEEQRELVITQLEMMESHSGWLPSPKVLHQYEEILPGLAERIVALPEREQAHRHKVVEAAFDKDSSLKARGQAFALVSLVLLVSLAFYLAWLGDIAWAARVAIFGIAGVVGIFVTGKVVDLKLAREPKGEDADDQSE